MAVGRVDKGGRAVGGAEIDADDVARGEIVTGVVRHGARDSTLTAGEGHARFNEPVRVIMRGALVVYLKECSRMAEYVLSEADHRFISETEWEVAVLPFGATEPHNYHMPYGTDVYQCDEIGRRAVGYAYERGAKVLLLPTVPFGVNTNHLELKGAYPLSITPTTLLAILSDLSEALERRGIRKLVLLNGHGGNELKPLMRQLHHQRKIFICLCDWFRMISDEAKKIFTNPGEHADEMETSLGLAFFPQFMKPLKQAGPGTIHPTKFEAIQQGWISITRPWHLAPDDTGDGGSVSSDGGEGTATDGGC